MFIKFCKTDGDHVSINPNFVVSIEWGLLDDEDSPTAIVTTKETYYIYPNQNKQALARLCGDDWAEGLV